jgi:hypothetical protein
VSSAAARPGANRGTFYAGGLEPVERIPRFGMLTAYCLLPYCVSPKRIRSTRRVWALGL